MGESRDLKAERVIKALERAGRSLEGQKGSHVQTKKEGNSAIPSVPGHRGNAGKKGPHAESSEGGGIDGRGVSGALQVVRAGPWYRRSTIP